MSSNEKSQALAIPSDRLFEQAEEELGDAGFYGTSGEDDSGVACYVTTSAWVNRQILHAIRSVNDDREVLGDIAKQLVIAGIPFWVVSVSR